MVAPSKMFEWPLKHFHCSQTPLHSGKTCFRSFLYDFYRFTISGLEYFSPLILTPLVLKGNNMSIESFTETLKFYFETILASSTTGSLIFAFICLFRNFSSEFNLLTTFILPPYLAAQTCWCFSERTHRIFVMATTQVVLEALLRQYKSVLTYSLLNSKIIQTLIFMISSAIIMHNKRRRLYNDFWFIKPELMTAEKPTDKEIQRENKKSETFWKYLFKNSKTYFVYGLSLDILNAILKYYSAHKSKGLPQLIWTTVKGLRLNITSFFVSYLGIYKFALYYLPNLTGGTLSTDSQHAIAAFFGGASYIFLNKLTCNTFALILAMQITWQSYCRKVAEIKQENRLLNIFRNIPFGKILFPINIVYIIYSFFYYNDLINSLGKNFVRAVTDGKTSRFLDYINKHELDFIVRDLSVNSYLGAF